MTQYKARVRQNTLLFPHDINLGTAPVRRNAPVTTTRSHTKTARRCLAVLSRSPCRTVEMLFRRGRQRNRVIGQRVQVADHVGALAVLRDTGKAHRGAGNEALRVGNELVEVVKSPLAAL